MSSVLIGKSIETEVSPLSSQPSHPLEGVVAEIPDKIKEDWNEVDAALIEFKSAEEEYTNAWHDYITHPSVEKWSVVVSEWGDVVESMSEFEDKLSMWKAEWFSTFHQAIPTDEVDVLFRAAKLLTPPVDPVPVTEGVAISFVAVDKAERRSLSLLERWVDAWTSYIKHPTKASWSDVAESWHEFQEAVRTIDERLEDQREKLLLAAPPEKPEEEARKVRHVISGADRKIWREGRRKDRDAWRENRWKERKERYEGLNVDYPDLLKVRQ